MSEAQALLLLRLFDAVVLIAGAAPELRLRYARNRQILERILAERRDPSPEEWAAVDQELDSLSQRLTDAAAR